MAVAIDLDRIQRVGAFLKTLPACEPSDWTFPGLPAAGDPHVIDYFFTAVKHQYGFWTEDGYAYTGPMYARVGGQNLKGSDFVWAALLRSGGRDPSIYNMERRSAMTNSQIYDIFADDGGKCPLPMFDSHCEIWRSYAKDMIRLKLTPGRIVESCRPQKNPVAALLDILRQIGGYKEDPLAKKAALLAVILANRPENFLIPPGPASRPSSLFPPIVDYHIQRSALRVGLVRVTDPDLESKLRARRLLSEPEEIAVRAAVYEAMEKLVEASGKGIDALDWFFFQNRRRCPEMTDPDCPSCEIRPVCPQRKDLFQPVRRTTYY